MNLGTKLSIVCASVCSPAFRRLASVCPSFQSDRRRLGDAKLFRLQAGLRTAMSAAAGLLLASTALAAPNATIKVRDTSYFIGSAFNFYVHIDGVRSAPRPELLESKDLLIRYVGAAPSSRTVEEAFTFTYEAVPVRAGKVAVPGGTVSIGGEDLEIAAVEIQVGAPAETGEMELSVELSQDSCYVGEPVLLTFTWTTSLSLNGMKGVDIRLPALADRHFRVREPQNAPSPDADAKNRIGVPVSHQRTICEFQDIERNGAPAMSLTFQRLLVPTQPGNLDLGPATLLCSYSKPREAQFKGTRYPEYFDNDFFDQDVVGEFERLFVKSAPQKLEIKPLPREGQPANFSGLVGAFELDVSAEPAVVEARQPVNLRIEARGLAFPYLLELPPLGDQAALGYSFDIPDDRARPKIEGSSAIFARTIYPLRETVAAVPALEFSYFDPVEKNYGVARSEAIPITVTRADAFAISEAQTSDGSKITTEVLVAEGGIFHNRVGQQLLAPRDLGSWMHSAIFWAVALLAPPLIFLGFWRFSQDVRDTRRDPEAARRSRAFRRFQRALRGLNPSHGAGELSKAVRRYVQERFDIAGVSAGEAELRRLLKRCEVDESEAEDLASLIAAADAVEFSDYKLESGGWEKSRVLAVVRQVERHASRAAVWMILLGFAGSVFGADPAELVANAERYLVEANEAALIDPQLSGELYKRSAEQLEILIHDVGIRNGDLFYNLGNTYFLGGDVGRSILNYRRAELHRPADQQLLAALKYVRTQRADMFPRGGWRANLKRAAFFHFYLTQPARVAIVLTLYAGIWIVAGLTMTTGGEWRWRTLTTLGIAFLLVGVSALIHATRDPAKQAVILDREVIARKGDARIYDPAFTDPLHSGAEVKIIEQRRDWLHIRLEDGHTGWIPASSAERIAGAEES